MKALTLDYFVGDKVWIMWPDAPKTSGLVAQIRILPGIIEYVVDGTAQTEIRAIQFGSLIIAWIVSIKDTK